MTFYPDPKPEKKIKVKKPLKRTPIQMKPKQATGRGAIMDTLIATRPHISFLSGLPIHNCSYGNCAHIVPAGKPEYKEFCELDPDNIQLLTLEEHHLLDHGTIAKREFYAIRMNTRFGIHEPVMWEKIDALYDELIEKYKLMKKNK